ncbi:hypothetical protein ACFZA2_07380 [Microbacterium sp. NPDC007973]|uniref:hypothetical protein n=1 Tax=Microbacterium sp. NPDC007973 TaxID=3364182 RepID=UPI0036F1889D
MGRRHPLLIRGGRLSACASTAPYGGSDAREDADGGRWLRERHGFDSLPLYVRPGAVIPWGARGDRPDYDYLDGLEVRVFPGGSGTREIIVTTPDGRSSVFTVDLEEPSR